MNHLSNFIECILGMIITYLLFLSYDIILMICSIVCICASCAENNGGMWTGIGRFDGKCGDRRGFGRLSGCLSGCGLSSMTGGFIIASGRFSCLIFRLCFAFWNRIISNIYSIYLMHSITVYWCWDVVNEIKYIFSIYIWFEMSQPSNSIISGDSA